MNIYEFDVKRANGEVISMEQFKNKPLLIVNTANHCGFTYQFEDLQKLYEKFNDQGFSVLGFPCNQFNNQNPEDAAETAAVCKRNFGVSFPLFEVTDVNGSNEHPLFTYLKNNSDCRAFGGNLQELKIKDILIETNPSYLQDKNIRWNFTKFLVDADGNIVQRFEPTDSLLDVEESIKQTL